jgi:transcriptional regulator with XRE-family HTH domain
MSKNKSEVLQRIKARTNPESKSFIQKNLEISEQIQSILDKKGWNQTQFAKELGKYESEVCKLLSGLHNLTLQSIAKMEAVLGEDIITTPNAASLKYRKIEYVTIKVLPSAQDNDTPNEAISYPDFAVSYPNKLQIVA